MHANATTAFLTLADTPAPVFLMSVGKPLVTLLLTVAYAMVAVGKLVQDSLYYNIKPRQWSAVFLACGAAGLLGAMMLPWSWGWFLGLPLMLAFYVTPCWLYVRARNAALAGTKAKPITFLDMDFAAMAAARRAKAASGSVSLKFLKKDRTEHPIPERKDPAFETYAALERILLGAMDGRALRIDLALSKQGALVQYTVDSVKYRREPVAGEAATQVVDLLKRFAGLDTAERRKLQTGTLAVTRGTDRTVLTVLSMGSRDGEMIRIDIEREKQLAIPFEKLGLTDSQRKQLEELTSGPGVILVGARPGNGLTALAYSLLSRHDAFTSNIKTLERRAERSVDGVEHKDFGQEGTDYAVQLQTIVRRGPDIILATEVMEPNAAKVMASPGARSTMFYAAMPSDSPLELMSAWLSKVGDPKAAATALRGVVTMRLVRTLCPVCRKPSAPNPNEAKMLAIPAGKQVQINRQGGKVLIKDQEAECPTCRGTGYTGVTGVFEVLPLDDESRTLLASGDVKGAYLQARRTAKSWSLQDSALGKVRTGETGFEEVKRVFAPPAATATGTAPAAPAAAPAAKK